MKTKQNQPKSETRKGKIQKKECLSAYSKKFCLI